MPFLDAVVDLAEVFDEVLFLAVLAEDRGHVLAEFGDDEGVYFCKAGSLDEVVQLAEGGGTCSSSSKRRRLTS